MSARPRITSKVTTIRADIGKHQLSGGILAKSPVGKLTNEQLVDVTAQLEHEIERMKGLDDDAAVKKLKADVKAVQGELERRAVCLSV